MGELIHLKLPELDPLARVSELGVVSPILYEKILSKLALAENPNVVKGTE